MRYAEKVKSFIIDNFLFGDEKQIEENTSFLSSNIIDSTGMLELVSFLEETYGVSIEDDDLLPENLDSLRNIETFLERKVGSTTGQSAG